MELRGGFATRAVRVTPSPEGAECSPWDIDKASINSQQDKACRPLLHNALRLFSELIQPLPVRPAACTVSNPRAATHGDPPVHFFTARVVQGPNGYSVETLLLSTLCAATSRLPSFSGKLGDRSGNRADAFRSSAFRTGPAQNTVETSQHVVPDLPQRYAPGSSRVDRARQQGCKK